MSIHASIQFITRCNLTATVPEYLLFHPVANDMEEIMWKAVLALTVAALVSGSGLALAREMSDREDGGRWQPSTEDIKAFTDARIAALKAGSS